MAQRYADRVRDTTVTVGPGNITLANAPPSTYISFGSIQGITTNDTFSYCIVSRSANEYETGMGQWLGSNQFARVQVFQSSNSNTLVSFSSGTKDVFLQLPAVNAPRTKLGADTTMYVRTDGNDSNNGLSNTSGGAFLTIQAAVKAAYALDFNRFTLTIQVGNGTYTLTSSIVINGVPPGVYAPEQFVIVGDNTTPANVIIQTDGATNDLACFYLRVAFVYIKGFTLVSSGPAPASGAYLLDIAASSWVKTGKLTLGAATSCQIGVGDRSLLDVVEGQTITGSSGQWISVYGNSVCHNFYNQTFTFVGTPTYSDCLIKVAYVSAFYWYATTVGSITGVSYKILMNAVLETFGTGSPPGTAGSITTGGQYE